MVLSEVQHMVGFAQATQCETQLELGCRCEVQEYAAGSDGFFSTELDDDSDVGLDQAVKQMVGDSLFKQACFLAALQDIAKPVNHGEQEQVCTVRIAAILVTTLRWTSADLYPHNCIGSHLCSP